MASTFLPPIVPSPFGKAFGRKPYVFADICNTGPGTINQYHYDYRGYSPQTLRVGSVPTSSIPAEGLAKASEKFGHYIYCEESSGSPSRRTYSLNAIHQGLQGRLNVTSHMAPQSGQQTETFPTFEDPRVSVDHSFEDVQYHDVAEGKSDQSWNWALDGCVSPANHVVAVNSNTSASPLLPTGHGASEEMAASKEVLDTPIGRTAENFRRWASTFRHKRGEQRHDDCHDTTFTSLAQLASKANL
jgi:hypothetical protein